MPITSFSVNHFHNLKGGHQYTIKPLILFTKPTCFAYELDSDFVAYARASLNLQVRLLEDGDYECPYCAQAYLITKEIQERLGDKLRFVFRPHAYETALAAEAAAAQTFSVKLLSILYEFLILF